MVYVIRHYEFIQKVGEVEIPRVVRVVVEGDLVDEKSEFVNPTRVVGEVVRGPYSSRELVRGERLCRIGVNGEESYVEYSTDTTVTLNQITGRAESSPLGSAV